MLSIDQVAARILAYCATKNGCENPDDLRLTSVERANVVTALDKMKDSGCEFNDEVLRDLVESLEQKDDDFDHYDGAELLFETMFSIIENA